MGVSTVERQITEIETTKPATLPEINWAEVDRLGINQQAPEMTSWKAIQKYMGVRRGVIRWTDGLLANLREAGMKSSEPNSVYVSLLERRRDLSDAQRFDRLRLVGRR